MSNPYHEALGATLIERTIRERIVLVGVTFPGSDDEATEASLDELALARSTPPAPTRSARMVQRRDHPDHTWFIGKGKAEELHELCLAVDADTVVFDNELSPAQQYNLEKLLGRTAIDRTAVILDIFAQNAHTLEGKAQVELALLRYRLPRLRRGADGQAVPAARRRRHPLRWRRDQARGRPPADQAPHQQARDRARRARPHPPAAAPAARPQRARRGDASSATRTPASRRCSTRSPTPACSSEDRLFATLDPTTRRLAAARRRAGAAHRHRRLRAPPAPRAGRGVQEHARGRQPGRLPGPRRRRQRRRPGGPDRRRARGARRDRRRPRARAARVQQGRPRAAARPSGSSATTPARSPSAPSTGEGIDDFLRVLADRLRSITDGRRAGRAVRPRRRAGRRSTARARSCRRPTSPSTLRVRARLSDASAGRLAEFVVAPATWPSRDGADRGRPASSRRRIRTTGSTGCCRSPTRFDGGAVDLSIGTPMRPAAAGRRRGALDVRTPSAATRRASAPSRCAAPSPRWIDRRFDVDVPTGAIGACIGTQGVRRHAAAVAAPAHARTATRCCTRRVATRPTRWARSSPAAGRSPCR